MSNYYRLSELSEGCLISLNGPCGDVHVLLGLQTDEERIIVSEDGGAIMVSKDKRVCLISWKGRFVEDE